MTETTQSASSGPTPANAAAAKPLRRLLTFLQPDRSDLWAVLVFALVIGGLLLATPIAVQALVNFVAFGGAKTPILVLAMLLACGLGLAAGLTALQTWIVEILQRRLFVRAVSDIAYRLPRLDPRRYSQQYGPELVNRFFDLVTVQKMTAFLLLDGLGVVLGVIIGMLVLAFYHPILLAFDIVMLLAVGILVYVLGRTGIATAIQESKAKYAMASWLEEVARQQSTFKNPDSRGYVVERADTLAQNYILKRRAHYRVLFRQILGALTLQVAANVTLLGVGGMLVVQGELTLGQLVAAELIVTFVVGAIAKMGKHFEGYYDLMAATDKLGVLFDVVLEDSGIESWTAAAPSNGSEVELNALRIQLRSQHSMQEALSFSVLSGERIALTGSIGTALVETLYGLREPTEGTATIDGLDVRTVDMDALRTRVAFAGRPEVFDGTMRDNIVLGRTISAEALNAALRCANLQEDVLALPQGLETPLSPHGAPLSQGQMAQLMIARAVAGQPGLLLVDGLLDGLSTSSAQKILRGLVDRRAGWTLILTTRRPDLAECCDRRVDIESPQLEVVR